MTNQWIEVDASRLASNMQAFRRHLGAQVLLAPVVKSNGYGHGLERAARAFVAGSADWLCVHSPAEARRVLAERLGVTVLMLGPWSDAELDELVAAGVHLTLSSAGRLRAVESAAQRVGRRALLHLKVETGTHRQGLEFASLREVLLAVKASGHLELVGMHSHFANIEDTTRHEFAAQQVYRFQEALRLAEELGVPARVRHIASSAATLLFPHTHYDLVRPGIAAYGYWPSRETLASARELGLGTLDLAPALRWKSVLTEIKTVPAGSYIGYGCTDKVEVDTRIGVVPVGYADGYRRVMGGRAHVLIHGRHCRIRGRICMNLLMVDVRHLGNVAEGDEVVLLGRQGQEEISAEQLADWAQTLHYEILAGLSAEIPRRGGAA